MSDHRFDLTDAQVEALIEGRNRDRDLASVSAAVEEIRALRDSAPGQPPAALIARAAAIAREAAPTSPAPPRPVQRSSWKFAPALAGLALMFTLTAPIAVFADSASPDDFLYPLDRLLEKVGIGDGGLGERLTEVEILSERGNVRRSAEHLARSITEAGETEMTTHHDRLTALVAELTAAQPDAETTEALETVSDMITEQPGEGPAPDPGNENPNKGPGNNSGNPNPGQGNMPPTQGNDNPNKGPGNNSGNNGNPGEGNPNAGPGNNQGNPGSDNKGPGDNPKNSNPGNQGNMGNQDSGNEGKAGGQGNQNSHGAGNQGNTGDSGRGKPGTPGKGPK